MPKSEWDQSSSESVPRVEDVMPVIQVDSQTDVESTHSGIHMHTV